MALWHCSICSSSRSSFPLFPPPHKGCRRPAVPRGHHAVTHCKNMSSEQDPLSPPSPYLTLWSSCLSFHRSSCSLFCFVCLFCSFCPKMGAGGAERALWLSGMEKIRMLRESGNSGAETRTDEEDAGNLS